MRYKLVAIDIDGTLINDRQELSLENIEAIKKIQDNDIVVAFSTGRIIPMIMKYTKYFKKSIPIIACNGAIIRKSIKNENYYKKAIDNKTLYNILDICKKEQLEFFIATENSIWRNISKNTFMVVNMCMCINKDKLKGKKLFKLIKNPYYIIEKYNKKIIKFSIYCKDSNYLDNEIRKIIEDEKIQCEITKTNPNNLEIMAKGTNKAEGLKKLSNYLNIPRKNIIAIGNSINDIPMLEYAGTKVLLENTDKKLWKYADLIAPDNNSNGVAYVINQIINAR